MEAKEAEGVKAAILEATMAIMGVKEAILGATMAIVGVKEEILGEGTVAMAKAAKVALMEVAMGMGMGVRVETLEEIVLGETVTTGTAVKGGLTEAIVETGIALEETATTAMVVKEATLAETTATALAETAIMVVEGEVAVVDEV